MHWPPKSRMMRRHCVPLMCARRTGCRSQTSKAKAASAAVAGSRINKYSYPQVTWASSLHSSLLSKMGRCLQSQRQLRRGGRTERMTQSLSASLEHRLPESPHAEVSSCRNHLQCCYPHCRSHLCGCDDRGSGTWAPSPCTTCWKVKIPETN